LDANPLRNTPQSCLGLGVDPSGAPIVSWGETLFVHWGYTFQRSNGGEWTQVAHSVFSVPAATFSGPTRPAFAIDPRGRPVMALTEGMGSYTSTIRVRRAGSLEPGPRREPVLAALGSRVFVLFAREEQLEVHTWDGQAWRPVGGPLQALPGETKLGEWALAVDPRGLPVVAWIEFTRNPIPSGSGGGGDEGETQVHVWRFQ
jgi:hypothetical protein